MTNNSQGARELEKKIAKLESEVEYVKSILEYLVMSNVDFSEVKGSAWSWRRLISKLILSLISTVHFFRLATFFRKYPGVYSLCRRAVHFLQYRTVSNQCLKLATVAIDSNDRKKSIFVDVTGLIGRNSNTGIQRVVLNLCEELVKFNVEESTVTVQPVAYNPDIGRFCRAKISSSAGFYELEEKSIITFYPRDYLFLVDLNPQLLNLVVSAIANPIIRRHINIGVCAYDLLPISNPEWFSLIVSKEHENWARNLLQVTDVLCISKTVSSEVSDYLRSVGGDQLNMPAIHSFRLGADIPILKVDRVNSVEKTRNGKTYLLAEFIREEKFILAVGTVEPRKGYDALVEIFEEYERAESAIPIVVVGRPGWASEHLKNRLNQLDKNSRKLLWFDNMDDTGLACLYRGCSGLIMLSRGEGFGLPVLEAIAMKKRVLARDLPIFREVVGDSTSVTFFRDDSELLHALLTFANHSCTVSVDETPDQVHWSDSARDVLKIINRV